jgi:hypothetical protein
MINPRRVSPRATGTGPCRCEVWDTVSQRPRADHPPGVVGCTVRLSPGPRGGSNCRSTRNPSLVGVEPHAACGPVCSFRIPLWLVLSPTEVHVTQRHVCQPPARKHHIGGTGAALQAAATRLLEATLQCTYQIHCIARDSPVCTDFGANLQLQSDCRCHATPRQTARSDGGTRVMRRF